MKIQCLFSKILIPAISILALPISALSQDPVIYTDLYYNQNIDSSGWNRDRYLENSAAWNLGSPDGEIYTGKVNSANNNLFINWDTENTVDGQNVFGYSSMNWNVHDINMDLTLCTHYTLLLFVENQKLTLGGDLSISLDNHAKWWSPGMGISFQNNTSMVVNGDMKVVNSTLDKQGYGQTGLEFRMSAGGNSWTPNCDIKGNLIFESMYPTTTYETSDRITFSLTLPRLNVGGYVDMTEPRTNSRIWDLLVSSSWENPATDITLGGLKGSGALQISYANNGMVNITFKNSAEYAYTGTYAARVGSENNFNIIMDAADAQNGKQSLYIKEGGYTERDGAAYLDASTINSVTVKNGTLDFATYDGMVNGNLEISGSGGRLEISSMIAGGTGLLAFETATFDRGTIEFTITELSADKIEISGALTKSGLGEINVEFDADTYDIREWISASGEDSIEYELITFGSTNMKESDFIAEDLGDGIFANLFIRDNALVAEFTTVPEPAHIAAVLAAAALVLAAVRRRKR